MNRRALTFVPDAFPLAISSERLSEPQPFVEKIYPRWISDLVELATFFVLGAAQRSVAVVRTMLRAASIWRIPTTNDAFRRAYRWRAIRDIEFLKDIPTARCLDPGDMLVDAVSHVLRAGL